MKEQYIGRLRCATCGDDNSFEFNEDKSYIKCTRCGREYHGGYDELMELNEEAIEEMTEQIKADAEEYLRKSLNDRLKGSKYLKIK